MADNLVAAESQESEAIAGQITRRRPWLIVLLGLLFGSFALIYCGQLRRTVAWLVGTWLLFGVAAVVMLYCPNGQLGVLGGVGVLLATKAALLVDAVRQGKRQEKKPWRPFQCWWGYLLMLVMIVLVDSFVLELKTRYWVEAFVLPANGMQETLVAGDRILVDKLFFNSKQPTRGQVVVFKHQVDRPNFSQESLPQNYVKRAIGVAGDTVSIKDNQVFVNGKLLEEPYAIFLEKYAPSSELYSTLQNFPGVEVPPGHVFVLGDNRWASLDSRFFGMVPVEEIVGVARVIFWSREYQAPQPTRQNPNAVESWGELRWNRIGKRVR